jgi:hypothetical protein
LRMVVVLLDERSEQVDAPVVFGGDICLIHVCVIMFELLFFIFLFLN